MSETDDPFTKPQITTGSFIERATKPSFISRIFTPANIAAGIGGLEAASALQKGQEAEDIAQERAAIERERAALDLENAAAVRRASVERASIMGERRRRFVAGQTSDFISGGVRTNVGIPLLAKAQAVADFTKDIGFDLEAGRVEAGQFISSAKLRERTARRFEKIGRRKKKISKLAAVGAQVRRSLPFLNIA